MATEKEFATFRLEGERFDAPGMPADSALEVTTYRDVIFEVARQLWLRANPDRSRTSPGVLENIELRLTGVKQGSSRPTMILHRTKRLAQEDFDEWEPFFLQARDLLTDTVASVSSTGEVPRKFPRSAVGPLSRMGRSLREDDEKITVGPPGFTGRKASLDRSFRATIKRIDEVLEETGAEAELEGVIFAFDSASRAFRLRNDRGEVTECRLDNYDERLATLAKQFCSLDGVVAPDVRVEGKTYEVGSDRIRSLHGVSHISEVRTVWEKHLMGRVSRLRLLSDGWNGPSSVAPPAELIDLLESMSAEIARIEKPLRIGPHPRGTIAIEWTDGDVEYTAEIEPGNAMFLCIDDPVRDEVTEREGDFDRATFLRFLEVGEMA